MADDVEVVGADDEELATRTRFWQKELKNALKREHGYRKNAERIVKIYEADTRAENSFNVLFSNTETLLPACYNQMPRPFVDRKFKDADPQGKLAAQALERALAALQDSGNAEYEPFSTLMEYAVLGALVPGRGVTWFKYEADFEEATEKVELPPDADLTQETAEDDVTGDDALEIPNERVKYETVCGEDLEYDEVLLGPGRQWSKIPWVARSHFMTEQDAVKNFGRKKAALLVYNSGESAGGEWKKRQPEESYPQGSQNVALVWEIWNKEKREVLFYAPQTDDSSCILKICEDPYELSGFFPCPEPLHFLLKRSKMTPTPLYVLYEEQAKELNKITTRINKILNALKIRGFYDGTIGGLKTLLEAEDNTLLPATNVAAMQAGQNLQNSIWLMPLEALISTLQSLWQGREELKNTIYEITGMADIMRGEGAASAPAALQNIKNQWGTLRLKRYQRYVQEYVRGCLRIMGELAAKHFSIDTFAQITDLDFATPEEIAEAQKTMNAVQEQMMLMAQQQQQSQMQGPPPTQGGMPAGGDGSGAPPPPGVPGGPPQQPDQSQQGQSLPPQAADQSGAGPAPAPQPPQLPPQMQQAVEQAQEVLAKPAWEDVLELLRTDLQRNFRIDIETNSTIAADTQEDKDDISDAMQALGTMFQSFIPMVQQGILTMPVVKSVLLTVARKFAFGREMEDAVNAMADQLPPPQQPAGPSPAEQQATEAEAQAKTQAAQLSMQVAQRQEEAAQQKHAFDMQKMQRDEQMAQQRHAYDMAKLQGQMQELAMKGQTAEVQAQADQTKAGMQVKKEQLNLDTAAVRASQVKQKSNGGIGRGPAPAGRK